MFSDLGALVLERLPSAIQLLSAVLVLFLCSRHGFAEDKAVDATKAPDNLFALSLEEVLDVPVTVASRGRVQSVRRAAGSISVLDAEFIANSGARNLKELLRLIPGFQFATDILSGETGSVRGLTADGRILLRIDGQDVAELAFQTIQHGGHYPTADMERVEIIRGPGSVLYGGGAQYAVVEVTTKHAQAGLEGKAVTNVGATTGGLSRLGVTAWQGYADKETSFTASASAVNSVRGSGTYRDFFGQSYDVDDHSDIKDYVVNLGGKVGDFSFRYFGNQYTMTSRDAIISVSPIDIDVVFTQHRAEVAYDPKFSDSWTGKIQANYSNDEPWNTGKARYRQLRLNGPDDFTGVYYNKHISRISTSATLRYASESMFSGLAGVGALLDDAGGVLVTGEAVPDFTQHNEAAYAEVSASPTLGTATVGSRFERNSRYESAWVSRLALTKAEQTWHSKFQIAQSFRAPGYEATVNFYDPTGSRNQAKPESSRITELEYGHELWKGAYLTGTIFDIKTEDTIAYFFDPEHRDSYDNLGTVGSRGFEGTVKNTFEHGDVSLTYAYYRARGSSDLYGIFNPDFTIANDTEYTGFAPHGVTLIGRLNIEPDIIATSTLQYQSAKYAYDGLAENEVPQVVHLSPVWPWNANLTFKGVGWKNFDIQTGINNILNQNVVAAQPALNTHAPMPGLGREIFANATIRW